MCGIKPSCDGDSVGRSNMLLVVAFCVIDATSDTCCNDVILSAGWLIEVFCAGYFLCELNVHVPVGMWASRVLLYIYERIHVIFVAVLEAMVAFVVSA